MCTFKKERFKIGEPAELQIGHIDDAIVTQMQNLQAAHQWLQTVSVPGFPSTQSQNDSLQPLWINEHCRPPTPNSALLFKWPP